MAPIVQAVYGHSMGHIWSADISCSVLWAQQKIGLVAKILILGDLT